MRIVLYSGLILAATGVGALADPNGDWLVEDGVAQIRIVDCGNSKWGVVSWEKTPGGIDGENPDASKRNRPTLGMPTLLNLKKKANAEEWEGSVYNAQNGKTYDSRIKLLTQDKLEIKGCVLGFLCGGQTWTRVIETLPAAVAPKPPAPAPKSAPASQAKPAATPGTTPTTGVAKSVPATAAKAGVTPPPSPLDDICAIPEIAKTNGTSGRAIN